MRWIGALISNLFFSFILLACVSPTSQNQPRIAQERLTGISRDALESCAGHADKELIGEKETVLTYYRKALLFETRPFQSKGSMALPHPVCRVDVLLEEEKVTEIQYHSLPAPGADDLCDAIFERCR